jgi:hypothetical protein
LEQFYRAKQDCLNTLLAQSDPVSLVNDPYCESDIAYIVIAVDPGAPCIREVTKGTKGSFETLADAKEAARQLIQRSITEAQKSLIELRQLGIDNIAYISL